MKLYDVPRNSRIRIDGREYDFDRVDGMYSLCFDMEGRPVHIAAFTNVEVVDGRDPGIESKSED
jgi:hypothetical protein